MTYASVRLALTMRKAFALSFLLLIALAAPATAVIGFCANMPCCFEPADAAMALSAPDCCTSINCSPATPQELNAPAPAKVLSIIAMLSASRDVMTAPAVSTTRAFEADSPPKTVHQRLATLSVFLI